MLSNTHVVITASQTLPGEPPALLNTPPAKAADARATCDPYIRVVEPPNSSRQILLGDLEDATASNKAEGKKSDTVDVGDDYDP